MMQFLSGAVELLHWCLKSSHPVPVKLHLNPQISLKSNLFHVKQHYGTKRFPCFKPFFRILGTGELFAAIFQVQEFFS